MSARHDGHMPNLGQRWIKVQPESLVRFFGVDYIFLYQFGVYLAVWFWAIALLLVHDQVTQSPTLLVAPPMVFIGYLIPRKGGLLLCAAGDAGMAMGTGYQAYLMNIHHESPFGIVLATVISACMAVRMIRDVLIILTPQARLETNDN